VVTSEGLRVIIKHLKSNNEAILSASLAAIINYATKGKLNVCSSSRSSILDNVESSLQQAVRNSDWMSKTLPGLLSSKNEKIRLRAAWAICNLTIHGIHNSFCTFLSCTLRFVTRTVRQVWRRQNG
jgi:hypothetical protein